MRYNRLLGISMLAATMASAMTIEDIGGGGRKNTDRGTRVPPADGQGQFTKSKNKSQSLQKLLRK